MSKKAEKAFAEFAQKHNQDQDVSFVLDRTEREGLAL